MLTPRELDVLRLVAQGLSNPGIAHRIGLSEHTVHRHLANILRKLGLSSRAAAARGSARRPGVMLARTGHPPQPRGLAWPERAKRQRRATGYQGTNVG